MAAITDAQNDNVDPQEIKKEELIEKERHALLTVLASSKPKTLEQEYLGSLFLTREARS